MQLASGILFVVVTPFSQRFTDEIHFLPVPRTELTFPFSRMESFILCVWLRLQSNESSTVSVGGPNQVLGIADLVNHRNGEEWG